jgi:hypothetical protein
MKTRMQELSEDILILSMLTSEPAKPTRNAITLPKQPVPLLGRSRTLSLQREHDIADNLAFLAGTSDNPEKVIAVCIEEQFQPNSCILRIAMNTNMPETLLLDLRAIAQVLEKADSQSKLALSRPAHLTSRAELPI